MELSVIVPSWNTRAALLACMESLERSLAEAEPPVQAEIFVVDNASSDGSAGAVRDRFPRVVVLELTKNAGYARACNLAIERATGDALLLLNSDAALLPGSLRTCLRALRETPNAGVAGPQLLYPDGRRQNSIHAAPSLLTELVPTFLLERLHPARFPSKHSVRHHAVSVEAVVGAVMFVRREVIAAVGPLPEAYFFFLEETEWCESIRAAGWQVLHVPGALGLHRSGESSKRRHPARTRVEFHRSLYRFFRRNRGPASLAFVVTARVLKNAGAILLRVPTAPFSASQRAGLAARLWVLLWHLRGCPEGMGLELAGAAPAGPEVDGRRGTADPRRRAGRGGQVSGEVSGAVRGARPWQS